MRLASLMKSSVTINCTATTRFYYNETSMCHLVLGQLAGRLWKRVLCKNPLCEEAIGEAIPPLNPQTRSFTKAALNHGQLQYLNPSIGYA